MIVLKKLQSIAFFFQRIMDAFEFLVHQLLTVDTALLTAETTLLTVDTQFVGRQTITGSKYTIAHCRQTSAQ